MTHLTLWMNLEHTMISERSRHRRTHVSCPFIRDVQDRPIYKTERMSGARAWGRGLTSCYYVRVIGRRATKGPSGWRRPEDSGASSLWGPQSRPHGKAPGRAERPGPQFPVCSTPSREGPCGGLSSPGWGAGIEAHSCPEGERV